MFLKIQTIYKTFSKRERLIFFSCLAVFFISLFFIYFNLFFQKTKEIPVVGGEFIEGIVGQPSFINPVLAESNSVDEDLSTLVFLNIPQLAESIKTDDSGKIWSVRIKEGLTWHDNEPITADDIVFTIQAIQDPNSRSSVYSNLQGVLAERISELEVKLTLSSPYSFFSSTLEKIRPIPKHIFGSIPPANFRLSEYNLEPVGSGFFKFVSYKKGKGGYISEYHLKRNDKGAQAPYLNSFVVKFYETQEKAIRAFNLGLIDGLAGIEGSSLEKIKHSYQEIEFQLPRYYALFLNSSANIILEDSSIRRAIELSVNREAIAEKVFNGKGVFANGPIVSGMDDYVSVLSDSKYSPEEAVSLIESAGWKRGDDGFFYKSEAGENIEIIFTAVVPEIDFLKNMADLMKADLEKVGIKMKIQLLPSSALNEILRTRNYEAILFGNAFFGGAPDLFSYWHSAERFYPGLNLSLYSNRDVDALIENAKKDLDQESRHNYLALIEKTIASDYPAIFLYSPNYIYLINKKLRGIEGGFVPSTSDRFSEVNKWHLKVARIVAK